MKKGDKLYCHTNLEIVPPRIVYFTKGESYDIVEVFDNGIIGISDNFRKSPIRYHRDNNMRNKSIGLSEYSHYSVHFYTLKELRKLKLKNIIKNRR